MTHTPRMEKIWQGESFGNRKTIRLDWSNDRHHEVVISGKGEASEVVTALLEMARLISHDPNLK